MKKSKKGDKMGKCSMITGGLVLGTVLVGGVLSNSVVNAEGDSAVDDVTIAVPVACTMSGVVDSAHTISLQAATYSGDGGIGKTTLSTHCNDNNGFSIYAVGFTGDTDGGNTLVGASSGETINTGIYTSGATDSSWSMKVSKVTDSSQSYNPQNMTITNSFDDWHVVPTSYTKVAEYHATTGSSTTDTVLGAKVETTYDAYIARMQTADSYTGKVKYVMVHPYTEEPLQPQPATSGCINYFANASDAVGTMGCQSASDGNSVTLLASNFSRTGYGFAGWSDSFDYATNPSAHFYGPNETITVPTGTTANGLSLYAVWVKSQGSIQEQSKVASICNSLTTVPTDGTANLTSVSALTDQRDNNTYAIAKLADGNCWMIENLRLGNTAEHNSDGILAQDYGGQFAGLAAPETADRLSGVYSANSLYSSDGAESTIGIGIDSIAYRMPRYNDVNTPINPSDRPQNPTSNSAINSISNASMYSYGNYYSWHAAIADTTIYSDGDHNTTSICPNGWKIPLGKTSTGDIDQGVFDPANKVPGFSYLDRKMGGTGASQSSIAATFRWRKYPVNFIYSGYINDGSLSDRGLYASYWTSTAHNYTFASDMDLTGSFVFPATVDYAKYGGRTLRCVFSDI